ncbi:diguanylate cyclase (GGDEF)-like protein [Janthinobacterium sp. CG_23.3]|uniref:tetratricopeptide repeat-containing diguanylate cyclase n=1 Tax=Janthinobacterium sp. CG_23.3 TaxID=3349634 RepID=UPI0038D49793
MLRQLRAWLALACLAPALACAQTALDGRIATIREQSRLVPDRALLQLQQIEAEARAAAAPTKFEFLAQLSVARMRLGQMPIALQLADELIAAAKASGSDAGLAKGMLTKAYVKFAMAEPTSSHQLAFAAERLAHTTGDLRLRVLASITAGDSWAEEGNYPAALAKLQMALDLARQHGEPGPLLSALDALAMLYSQMKEYEKGFLALQESLQLIERLGLTARLVIAKNTEYCLAIESNQPERALQALLTGLELERQLGASSMIASTLVNLSDSYLKRFDYAKAQQYGEQAIAAARLVNDEASEATAHVNIGQALLGKGRLAEGKKSFERGLAYYEKADNKPEIQSVLKEYGSALERAGDMTGAVAAYHRERGISNLLFESERQKAVYELQEKYETEKKQRQIELLSRENQVKSAELDNRKLQQRVWWLLAVVFALASAVVGLLYRKVRHANVQLQVKNLELKQQSSRDPLTGLYNRRHFQEFMRLHNQVEQHGAVGDGDIVGALFLLDIDHFKHVNDGYGHAAGDAVLKMIAENLRELLRETDMIVRWGGEEFLAFLPAVPRNGVDEVARRVLRGVSTQRVSYQGKEIAVNVSIGFAPFPLVPLDAPLPWERAVNLVDMALYLAKAHGRNRAYGVRSFNNFGATSMESIEQDLELAWRAGFVDLSIVLGAEPDTPPGAPHSQPARGASNVVPLKPASR